MGNLPKPMGSKLKFGDLANMSHLKDENEVFELSTYYNLQKMAISDYIKTQLNKDNKKQWSLLNDAIKKYADVILEVSNSVLDNAKKQFYQTNCPGKQKIVLWAIIFWIAIAIESGVLIVQGLFSGDFNPFIIVLAVLLAIGGFFQGNAIGSYLHSKWLTDLGENIPIKMLKELGLFILGTIIILFVSTIRAIGSYDIEQLLVTFFTTLFLGEAVSFSEAVHIKYKEQRDWCIQKQDNACKFYATIKHKDDIDKGIYKEIYDNYHREKNGNETEKMSKEIDTNEIKNN